MSKEQVNHPEHYGGKDNPYEAIKIIDAMGWGMDFCLGNALKYIVRAGKKDDNSTKQDLNKAIWYLEHAVELIETDVKNMENGISDFIKVRESEDDELQEKDHAEKCKKYKNDFINFIKKRESKDDKIMEIMAEIPVQELNSINKNYRIYSDKMHESINNNDYNPVLPPLHGSQRKNDDFDKIFPTPITESSNGEKILSDKSFEDINDEIKIDRHKKFFDDVRKTVSLDREYYLNKIKKLEEQSKEDEEFVKSLYPPFHDSTHQLTEQCEEPVFSLKENEVIKILENISDITPKFKDKVVEILKSKSDSSPFSSELGTKNTDI